MFLADCKDVVVSCVIVEPIYNHEREGRGNFVQEGKSGELASPPSLTQSSSVGGRLSASPLTATASKSTKTLTFIVQSIVASHWSFSRFCDCWRYFFIFFIFFFAFCMISWSLQFIKMRTHEKVRKTYLGLKSTFCIVLLLLIYVQGFS